MSINANYELLIKTIQGIDEVIAIGKSGGEQLPVKNENDIDNVIDNNNDIDSVFDNDNDIDIFIFCNKVPDMKTRQAAVNQLGNAVLKMTISDSGGKFWGVCDFVFIKDMEICLMYFTVSDMNNEIETVLNGSRLEREDEYFYPAGRCATFLSMYILYDKMGYISNMQNKLSEYPPKLAEKMIEHHIKKLSNDEDFERAVSRSDVLFYHATLGNAIDHFLQALFAINRCYFPSRKRSLQFIEKFKQRPADCSARLLEAIKMGASENTLAQSYEIWSSLCRDLSKTSM